MYDAWNLVGNGAWSLAVPSRRSARHPYDAWTLTPAPRRPYDAWVLNHLGDA